MPGEAEVIGRVAHLCLIGGQQAGLRRDAVHFNSFLSRAFSLFEGALPPWRTRH
jgi:hypothetical protein